MEKRRQVWELKMIENILNLDNLTKYTDAELENIEKGIAKEKKRRKEASKIRAKLEKQASALGYTLTQKDGGGHGREETEAKEAKPASGWNL